MAPATLDPSTVRTSAIEALHSRCVNRFAEHFQTEIEIAQLPELRSRWKRRDLQGEVVFFLWPKRTVVRWGLRPVAGTRCPVVPAKERGDAWGHEYFTWVGWREVWTRETQDEFKLHDASFTFYAGRDQIEPIGNQLFRAEWPQSSGANGKSAHPHWHVDWPLENLVDEVSGIHFGMAGWNCNPDWQEGDHVSGNWRRDFGGDIGELETWAVRTLEYSLDQIAACYDPQLA